MLLPWLRLLVAALAAALPGSSAQRIRVDTADGCVLGDSVSRALGAVSVDFFSFKGIPYAAPPTGQLRWKNPRRRPLPARDGCLLQLPDKKCPQNGVPFYARQGEHVATLRPEGQENCLQLNVYVPGKGEAVPDKVPDKVPEGRSLPVLFYIHGGGFTYGSGIEAEAGPEFLMRLNNTILVTINYRLGALGFLNLDNDDAPGNMGLKDQRAALQWVQDNIRSFGGDPKKVTIFGNAAGASSVHYHTLVPFSKGLFRSAIMQSGNALAPTAYQETHFKYARKLVEVLTNATGHSAARMGYLLRMASVDEIRAATFVMVSRQPELRLGYPPFCPSPERRSGGGSEERFLEADPEYLTRILLPSNVVPTVIGIAGEEGLFPYHFGRLHAPDRVDRVAQIRSLPHVLIPPGAVPFADTARLLHRERRAMLARLEANKFRYDVMLRAEYGTLASDEQLVKLLGDISVVHPTRRLVEMTLPHYQTQNVPLYQYHFAESGQFNWGKVVFGIPEPKATTTDELGYLFRISAPRSLFQDISESSSSKTLQLLTRLWTDFANGVDMQAEHGWPRAQGAARESKFVEIKGGRTSRRGDGLGGAVATLSTIFSEIRN